MQVKLNATARIQLVRAASADEAGKVLIAVEKILGKHAKTREKLGTQYVDWKSTKDWAAGIENRTGEGGTKGSMYFVFQPKAMRNAWIGIYERTAEAMLGRIQREAAGVLRSYGDDSRLAATKSILEKLSQIK